MVNPNLEIGKRNRVLNELLLSLRDYLFDSYIFNGIIKID